MGEAQEYIVEVNETEVRLREVADVCRLLEQVAASDSAAVWAAIDHGRRRRNWLERLFGVSDRDVESCFWLAKAGDVAALTFFDGAGSEYQATDPGCPVGATHDQRMALSCGEPTPAPPRSACNRLARSRRPSSTSGLASGQRG